MAAQLDFLPVNVVDYMPFPDKTGRGRAVGDNGITYIVKSDTDRPVCATEWICTLVAEALNLPVAQPKILLMRGKLVFGSEFMSNKLRDDEVAALLCNGNSPNDLRTPDLRNLLAKIYALDLLIGNHDRHAENYLISLEGSAEHGIRTGNLRPFDFESANIVQRKGSTLPFAPTSHTLTTSRTIRKVHQFEQAAAQDMLTQLSKGREFIFERATNGLPDDWLSATQRSALLDRVRSSAFEQEIYHIKQGLNDGSYL